MRKDAEKLLEQTDSDLAVTREKLGESLENAGALSQEVRALLEDKDGLEKDLGRVELALQVEEDRCRSALQHVDQGIRSRRSAQQKQEKMKEELTLMKIEANHAKAEAEKVHVDIEAIRQELEDWKSECVLLGKKLKHNAKKASADLQKAKDGEDAAALGLDGTETFSVEVPEDLVPRQDIKVTARSADGIERTFHALARVDTPVEVDYYRNGGILHTVLRKMADS